MNECLNCDAPGGHPYCSTACRDAATAPEVPASTDYTPPTVPDDPWATDARNHQ